MADAIFAIDRKIAQLSRLKRLPQIASKEVAAVIEREINRNLAAGLAPDGTPWPLRKDTGARALQGARKRVKVGAIGPTIIVRLVGRELVLHHHGHARGKVRRQVIPEGSKLPPEMAKAVEKVIRKAMAGVFDA